MSCALAPFLLSYATSLQHQFQPFTSPHIPCSSRRCSCPVVALLRGRRVQVITDIDDTIKSSGGVALGTIPLGGVDTSFARGACYPGVFRFGAELAAHAMGSSRPPAPMAVLTARAREFRWALEIKQSDKICQGFRRAGEAAGLSEWGIGPVLYGSVQEWICQERKGWRKFENFKVLRASSGDSDLRWVFVGDNGSSEKDLEAAEMIISEYPRALRAVFMHAVSGNEQPATLPEDNDIDGVPFRYFRTYATAASKAAKLGLLSNAAAHRVLDAVEEDMRADPINVSPGSTNEQLLLDELSEARSALRFSMPSWTKRLMMKRS
jgi:hypothetical protein